MAEYTNPTNYAPEYAGIENPFFRGFQRQRRENALFPFLQAAEEEKNLALQKERQTTQEFLSTPFSDSRVAGANRDAAVANARAREVGPQADLAIDTARAGQQTLPGQTALTNATNTEKLGAVQGVSMSRLMDEVASAYNYIQSKATDPMQQQEMGRQVIQQWQAKNPNTPLPAFMQTYDPQRWGMIAQMQTQTPKHRQEMEKATANNESRETINQYRLQSAQEIERMRAESRKEIESLKADNRRMQAENAPTGTDKRYSLLNQWLHDPNISEEEKQQYRAEIRSSPQALKAFKDFKENYPFQQSRGKTMQQFMNEFYESQGWGPSGNDSPQAKSPTGNQRLLDGVKKVGGKVLSNGKFELTEQQAAQLRELMK